jgi:hypothetical protein
LREYFHIYEKQQKGDSPMEKPFSDMRTWELPSASWNVVETEPASNSLPNPPTVIDFPATISNQQVERITCPSTTRESKSLIELLCMFIKEIYNFYEKCIEDGLSGIGIFILTCFFVATIVYVVVKMVAGLIAAIFMFLVFLAFIYALYRLLMYFYEKIKDVIAERRYITSIKAIIN